MSVVETFIQTSLNCDKIFNGYKIDDEISLIKGGVRLLLTIQIKNCLIHLSIFLMDQIDNDIKIEMNISDISLLSYEEYIKLNSIIYSLIESKKHIINNILEEKNRIILLNGKDSK